MMVSACDLLCFAAHSDDAEIALGGTLAAWAARGHVVWVCDLTRGELASNADPETRWQEARAAGGELGLAGRVQLALPDGFLAPQDRSQTAALVWILRQLRPRWVLTAPAARRHPDHLAMPPLVRRAVFLSRLRAYAPPQPDARWWPDAPSGEGAATWIPEVVGDTCGEDRTANLLVDVSASWPQKERALACFASQFRREQDSRATAINEPAFLADVEARARRWGRRAGVPHAEALVVDGVPVVNDLPAERRV